MYAAKIDLLFESALILASVCFSLSVYVLSKGVSNKLNLAYSALTLNLSVWAFAYFMANVLNWRLMESVHLISTLLVAPLSLLFLNVLLLPEGFIFRWLLRVSLVSSVLLIPLVTFGLDRTPAIRDMSYFSPTIVVFACLYLFVSENLGAVKPRGVKARSEFSLLPATELFQALKRRNFWIYLGGACVTLLSTMDRVPWMGRTVPAVGNFLLALYFYFIKDAVLLQSLVSARRMIGRLLTGVVAAVVIFSIFILITTWVKTNTALYLINAFLAAYVAAVSIDPVRSLVNYLFQRFFFREAARIEALTQAAGKEIAGAFSALAIAQATEKFLSGALQMPMMSFYALDGEGKKFLKIFDSSPDRRLPEFLPPSYPLFQYWKDSKSWKPILNTELLGESQRAAVASRASALNLTAEALAGLQSTLALPLVHNRSVLGFATLSADEPPEAWEESWGVLGLLAPYFQRAGEALHELDVYARLRNRDRLATIGEMAAGLAHEIRNPLGAIKGAAQVLEPKPGDPQEPFLKIIVEEVNRLNGVVSQFLDYAKPFQSEHEYADLGRLLGSVVERFRRQKTGDPGVELHWENDLRMPQVLCQPELIAQVLVNLLENSWNALASSSVKRKKSPYISVRLDHTIRGENAEVVLSVEDNGPGMSPETIDKIFIPFFTSSPQGTGLGLSICQKIAEAHGGRMEVISTLGEGTLMTLRFSRPWRKMNDAVAEAKA